MILTNEQIESRLDKFLAEHPNAQWDSTMAFRDMCQAQLKQDVEWMKERATFMEWEWKDSKGVWDIIIDDITWQALLKEVD